MRTTVRLPLVAILALTPFVTLAAGCGEREDEARSTERREAALAEVDAVMVELGGEAAARLDRGQRWRMISSIGAGLPPPMYRASNLPEPESRGARLVGAYCVQCHWIPAPEMHSAEEWPVLMRRMQMRAQTLHDRMGGPLTRDLVGEILLSGMASAILPSPEDADSLLAYFERNAMPAIDPEELGEGPEVDFFVDRCALCHETPDPAAHTLAEWNEVVGRMRANMAVMGVQPLTDEEVRRVLAFLEEQVNGQGGRASE